MHWMTNQWSCNPYISNDSPGSSSNPVTDVANLIWFMLCVHPTCEWVTNVFDRRLNTGCHCLLCCDWFAVNVLEFSLRKLTLLILIWLMLWRKELFVIHVLFVNLNVNSLESIVHDSSSSNRRYFQTECKHWNSIVFMNRASCNTMSKDHFLVFNETERNLANLVIEKQWSFLYCVCTVFAIFVSFLLTYARELLLQCWTLVFCWKTLMFYECRTLTTIKKKL